MRMAARFLSLLRLCVATSLAFTALAVHADEPYQLKVVTDRADAIYRTEATAKFIVTVTKGGETVSAGEVLYIIDDFLAAADSESDFPKGTIEVDDKNGISATSSQPGFLRCRVTFQTPDKKVLRATAAAGFSPNKISPSLPVPDDFDQFWKQQKAELAKVALEPKLKTIEQSNEKILCFDVRVNCLGGAPVSGYLAKPKEAKAKSLPAILWVHGAGVRSSSLANAMTGAQAGMLSMDINAHGIANGMPPQYYKDQIAGPLKNYRHAGRESRETIYFRGMYLRLVRAIDFLTSLPEWDGQVIAVIGHSQGGGQALVAGGIDDRVTFIAAGVPAICDHSGRAAGRINGWPKLVPVGDDGLPDGQILQASRYVDAVNFASRCRANAIVSVGFVDAVCPPSSCYAAFNQLHGKKRMVTEPLMGHAAPQHIRNIFFAEFQKHVRDEKGQN
ncbi:MAG TPA: acetylxylan esterase [Planctomycetes bacterium]|nr:acetylxylan esterase [Planctomycetota bacterium]